MELTGKIKVIKDTEVVGTKGFQKRLFVVETDEKYPQQIPLEFVKDKVDLLDNFSVGQQVKVEFNLRGNEYNGRYYVSLQAWKIEGGSGGSAKPAASKTTGAAKPAGAKPAAATKPATDDDVPWA